MGINKNAIKDEDRIKEYEGHMLDEVMSIFKGNVKVGTEGGNGFIFCGTPFQYRNERDELNDKLMSRRNLSYESAKKSVMDGIEKPGASVSDYMKSLAKHVNEEDGTGLESIEPTIEGYLSFLRARFETLAARSRKVERMREACNRFKPAGERKIKLAYMADSQFDPPNTLILNIEGGENGDAWTVEEYREKVKRQYSEEASDVIPFGSEEYERVFGNDD